MILFNGLEITSNEQFLVWVNKIQMGEPFPISIFYGKLRYYAMWNYIINIEFLDKEVIKPTICMQDLEISENAELNSDYEIKIVSIKPLMDGIYTEVTLELNSQLPLS